MADTLAGVRIGDAVAWADVPDGALVRWLWDGHGLEYFYRRHEYCVSLVGSYDGAWCPAGRDDGSFASSEPVTIVALGLTGRETADDLRRLAEVFEVREAWCGLQRGNLLNLAEAMYYDAQADDEEGEFFERLRAVGWRSGMSAEDADRLLAAEEDR